LEKLTSLLVVVSDGPASEALLAKAVVLASRSGARIELLLTDPTAASALATRFSAIGLADKVSYALDGTGEPLDDLIVRHLANRPADLVMKSADGVLTLRRVLHVADDMDLAAALPVPLLRVGAKAWKAEMRVAAAVDVSDRDGDTVARSILNAAGLIAMQCEATLDVLYSERETRDESLRMERAVRVARLVREFHIGGERLRVLDGPPDQTLPRVVSAGDYDIVAIGAIPRRLGSLPWSPALTSLLTNTSPADVLLVKPASTVESGMRATTDVRSQ
jgi:nucleotide-binding universal stress UspA family protein